MIDQKPDAAGAPPDIRRPIVVLLVDDQKFIGSAVGQLLAAESDMELHYCDRALDAVATANRVAPTVILQDLVMPDIDGLTLVGLFRTNPATAGTPVVVLSGNDDAATRAKALAQGAADYLTKLPPRADLIACIRRHSVGAPPVPPKDPTIDLQVIAQFDEAGAPEFTRRLIAQFVQEAEACVHALRDAATRADRAALSTTAHSLKGSSGIMGARRLAALCAQLEREMAASSETPVTPALMSEIEQELIQVRVALTTDRPGAQP
jgi:DNA-binding response OmpR family regulator